ncbi:leucine-rich repeat domain-containing protein [Roseivirga pacifica]
MKTPFFSKHSLLVACAITLTFGCKNNDDSTPDFVNIPDAKFEQKLIEQGIDSDNTINQRISISDALAVTSLNLSNYNEGTAITDLTGIEAFTNLTSLVLTNNMLTTIDVSKNTSLVHLNLLFNELTSVDGLNAATQLKTLNISWNFLSEISLDLPSLEVLNLSENDLTSINVEKCENLNSLLAKSNELTALNVSQNAKLSTLILSDNKIEQIDLSNNAELEYLWISANKLQALDVSQLTSLHNLSIINNPDLYCVTIAKDQTVATVNKTETQMLFEGGCW